MPARFGGKSKFQAASIVVVTGSKKFIALTAAVACSIAFLTGCNTGPVPAPTAYTRFNSNDKQYSCEYPEGWEVTAAGGTSTLSRSAFEKGSAKIAITADVAGSLKAGPAVTRRDPDDEPVVVKVHETSKEKLLDILPGAEEQPPAPFTAAMQEGRVSEFTAPGSMGKKIKGYRATLMLRDRRLVIICQCAESDWENLKPAFKKVITSISPGSGN